MPARSIHLIQRFFGSVCARSVVAEDEDWVAHLLTGPELELWRGLGRTDKVESVDVARRFISNPVVADAQPSNKEALVAAALLHDIGKADSQLGTSSRVLATVSGRLAGPQRSGLWIKRRGLKGRIGSYLHHAEIGADLIRAAGGRELVASWAGVHHDPARWETSGIPISICRALARADGESVVGDLAD